MATEISSRNFKIGLFSIIIISIAAGVLATVSFEEWLRRDPGYLLHGAVAMLFLGVIFLRARKLYRVVP